MRRYIDAGKGRYRYIDRGREIETGILVEVKAGTQISEETGKQIY